MGHGYEKTIFQRLGIAFSRRRNNHCDPDFIALVVGAIALAAGNLAFWPFLVSMLFGHPITPLATFGVGAILLAVVVLGLKYFPDQTEGGLNA
ncbi:MAG TPA: hypothetical protein VJ750_02965, partial [Rhizomicrobium sp.]|nr:hypothetical protein [Rhizomicrobium sp.]